MEQALAFIRLRMSQIGMDLQVYKDLGPLTRTNNTSWQQY